MTKQVTDKQVERMYELFRGLNCAYGTYDMSQAYYEGKKLKGIPKSILESVEGKTFDRAFWLEKIKTHLTSKAGLGIVPIDEESNCRWGCIDVDKYDLDYQEVLLRIKKYNFPLVTTVSKSGGLHLWVFMKKPAKAFVVINYLKNVKAQLGMADVEIFPKQMKVLYEHGDSGSWVNIPMACDDTRYLIRLNEESQKGYDEIRDIDTFLNYAESMQLDKLDNSEIKYEKETAVPKGTLKEAPPCLKTLMEEGFTEGSRNIIMYNIGVYLKKVYGELWEAEFEKFNQQHCDPPLAAQEVLSIQKSVNKKDYRYLCSQQPLCAYCNPSKCRTSKYGVGDSSLELRIESIAKVDTEPAIWFATVGEARMILTSEQLLDQKKFQLACMEKLTRMPVRLKDADWAVIIDALIQDAVIIPAAPDSGTMGTFNYWLEEYCSKRGGYTKEDLLRQRAYKDLKTNFTYFSLTDFMVFLKQNGFTSYTKSYVSTLVKERGGGHQFFNIAGKGMNTHYIPSYPEQESKFTVPDMKSEDLI